MWSRHDGKYNSRLTRGAEGVFLGLRQDACLPNLDHNGKTFHYLEKKYSINIFIGPKKTKRNESVSAGRFDGTENLVGPGWPTLWEPIRYQTSPI